MEDDIFSRNKLYWGEEFQKHLASLYITVAGLGGVGGYALDALARAGVGKFLIIDFDTVSLSNINRQLIALHSTIGLNKTDLFYERIKDINPLCRVDIHNGFITKEDLPEILNSKPDYLVDAIDTVKSKVELLKFAKDNGIKTVSSFGAGNRMDASKLYVTDISKIKSSDCFIKNIIYKLKKYAGIYEGLAVVTSTEPPYNKQKVKNVECVKKCDGTSIEFTKFTPASTPVVPAVAGYLTADYILRNCYNEFLCKTME